jgi:hypothetical protein
VHDDVKQRGVREGVVLPLQLRRRPSPYTGKVLKAKTDTWHHGLSFLAPGPAGDAPQRTEESGGRRASRGFGSCQPTSLVDRPPHGEEPPHLRDDRGCRPYSAGTLAAAACAFSSEVRSDEGEARGQP